MSKIIISDPPSYNGHIVPCQIHHSGEARTEEYFHPSKTIENSNHVAYFRGCKFIGKPLDLSGYDGYLVSKSESLEPDGDDYKVINTYSTVGKLESLVVYGHDRLPNVNGKYGLMGEWEKLSQAIHG